MSKKILLIDDDDLVRRSVESLLKRNGYAVVTAASADEAVSQAKIINFELIVTDVRMPGENGIRAIEKIKAFYEKINHICGFIVISGYAEEDTPALAIRLGVTHFLSKPFDSKDFLNNIQKELQLLADNRRLKSKTSVDRSVYSDNKKKENKRVVITGVGVVSPFGIGRETFWKGLKEGKNGVGEISLFDSSKLPCHAAAEVRDFQATDFITEETEIKRMSRSSQIAVAAAKLSLRDANVELDPVNTTEVILGSSTSGVEYMLPDAYSFAQFGLNKVRPYVGLAGFVGAISSEISRALNAHGMSLTISTGCTSATDAMGYALRLIQNGVSDRVITGGVDACVCDGIIAAFCRMGAMSSWKGDPRKASRPFNKDREGFIIGEGGWIFVFEELEKAFARKAKIYAEVLGYGSTCDAWHMTRPHPSGDQTVRAINAAVMDAGLEKEQVDIFEAYGNATKINDSYETNVVKKVFGAHSKKILMPSVKSMLGHPIGASGAQQMAAGLLAINEGFIHPTINYETPDPECDLNYVPNIGRAGDFRVVLCNSLAFGGKNASIVIRQVK
ncbi:MAG TPA: beta-ketoacyl-ACP synthase II [Candidatus Omnitrophota bacterium]|nr:beta-ketoacyl-ACP synthase II [Candidatus Omnitrophota bacterium]HPS36705.1 beta-ketoacyl-ACP synthase II [Candidatus Omnitrophota bacterium]